ncbi:serine hydrolase domain-containing protein [Thermodesulfobacteriota bacterium]
MKKQLTIRYPVEKPGSFLIKKIMRYAIFSICFGAAFALIVQAESAPADNDSRWFTPTMVNARANMFHPELNCLLFQHMDKMFATRSVQAGEDIWQIPSSPVSIKGKFEFKGNAYNLKAFLEKTACNALLVIKDGRIIQEIYRNGSDEETTFISFSMAKSFVATLIGIALHEGKLKSLDDKVSEYLPEMKNSGYEDATIRDLLRMRSGVAWEEIYRFGSDTQLTRAHDDILVAYRYRWCDYAAKETKRDRKPGEKFNYSTLDTSVLGCLLERAIGMTGSQYMTEKIWKPAGMENDGYWIMDGPDSVGREFFGAGFNATLRDYGRFGLLMLRGGVGNGTQIIPAEWVKKSTVPDEGYEPTAEGQALGYQYQWWTIPDSDAYLAIGLHNQFIYIDPKNNTVIVKLSHTPTPLGWEAENLAFFQKLSDSLIK